MDQTRLGCVADLLPAAWDTRQVVIEARAFYHEREHDFDAVLPSTAVERIFCLKEISLVVRLAESSFGRKKILQEIVAIQFAAVIEENSQARRVVDQEATVGHVIEDSSGGLGLVIL